MDYPIIVTPAQLIAGALAVCTAVVTISKAVEILIGWRHKAKQPEADQDAKIADLETRLARVEGHLKTDKGRLDALDESTRVMLQAQLALLGHAIDGNNVKPLQDAREALHTYLVEK